MILENETLGKFGYQVKELSRGSYKLVVVKCDYCGKIQDKKYGVRNNGNKILDKDACKDCGQLKRKEATIKKYGTECTLQNEDVKRKRQETWDRKYGGHPLKDKKILDKVKKTTKKRFGVDNAAQSVEIQKKIQQTCMERYGVDNGSKTDAAKRKISIANTKDILHGKNSVELASDIGIAYSSFRERVQKYGLEMAVSMEKKESGLELKMRNWLSENGITYESQKQIEDRIADFVLVDHNIVVELDGLYWHSDANIKDDRYHQTKRDLYIKNGLTPLFFREDEVLNKWHIITSIIKNKMGDSKRYYARKMTIREVPNQDLKDFLNNNHLMGYGKGVGIGLYLGDKLCSVIQIKKVNGEDYEVSRFCHLCNTTVIGGFSRLISYWKKNSEWQSLRTFIDLRYGSGEYLTELGFEHINTSLSFRWTSSKESVHRLKYRSNSGYKHGLFKIWDCGQAKYVVYNLSENQICPGKSK